MDFTVGAYKFTVALWDIQARPILRVVGQPGGLVRHEVTEIQQALELDEAAYAYPAAPRLLAQGLLRGNIGDDL